jgi:two-component system OmpR family sensor kinase
MTEQRRAPRAPGRRRLPYLFSLQRRLFLFFGATILVTALAAAVLTHVLAGTPWSEKWNRMERLFGDELARVWDDPAERRDLAKRVALALDLSVELRAADGTVIEHEGKPCRRPMMVAPVLRDGAVVGLALWWTAGRLSQRILRPLSIVVRVAEDLGAGKLSTRAHLKATRHGEEEIVAESLNRMADRIERQIADQRELLAVVSHEMRTPLGHMRLLIEMARDGGADPKLLSELEKEIAEVDALTGDLLANSRLNFATLSVQHLDGADLARRALDRAGLPSELLQATGELGLDGDPTLLSRALANLLENARRHAGGPTRLIVNRAGDLVRFAVEDQGPGFPPGTEASAFDAYRQRSRGSPNGTLGLGLNLVQRIARAHGGEAFAENRPEGGARVGLTVNVARQGELKADARA